MSAVFDALRLRIRPAPRRRRGSVAVVVPDGVPLRAGAVRTWRRRCGNAGVLKVFLTYSITKYLELFEQR